MMGRWFSEAIEWLVTHLVALGFLLFFVVAVVFRADLFSFFMKQPPRGASAEEKAVAEARLAAEIAARNAAQAKRAAANGHLFRPLEPTEVAKASVEGTPEEKLPVATASPANVSAQTGAGGRQVSKSPRGSAGMLRPVGPQEQRANEQDGAELGEAEADALLAQAREAFRTKNWEQAEALYRRYIRVRPDDPDGFGELGNVFHAQGRDKEARDAYFEAGLRLKLAGDQDRLRHLVEWLKNAGDPRAQVLAR
ncbi:MAG: hypothetical protein D6720_12000 [Gammaproteobacteria bacterium]|nr:MAG: hypothetical protein D6720_12000 [Gammaproteobacteria bacterium]